MDLTAFFGLHFPFENSRVHIKTINKFVCFFFCYLSYFSLFLRLATEPKSVEEILFTTKYPVLTSGKCIWYVNSSLPGSVWENGFVQINGFKEGIFWPLGLILLVQKSRTLGLRSTQRKNKPERMVQDCNVRWSLTDLFPWTPQYTSIYKIIPSEKDKTTRWTASLHQWEKGHDKLGKRGWDGVSPITPHQDVTHD